MNILVTSVFYVCIPLMLLYYLHLGVNLRSPEWKGFWRRFIGKLKENRVRFAPVYLFIFAVCYYGMQAPAMVGEYVFPSGDAYRVLLAVTKTTRIFAMNFEMTDAAGKLMTESMVCSVAYRGLVYYCFAISLMFGLLFVSTFLYSKISNRLRVMAWHRSEKKLLLVGSCEENQITFRSAEKERKALIVDDDVKSLENTDFTCEKKPEELLAATVGSVLNSSREECIVVINTHDEERNMALCCAVLDQINAFADPDMQEYNSLNAQAKKPGLSPADREELLRKAFAIEKRTVEILKRLRVYVFGDQQYEEIYQDMQSRSLGILEYTNHYKKAAFQFVMEHPMTEFLAEKPEAYLDSHGCVGEDVELNVLLIGFGDTNQQILSASIAANQFIQCAPGQIPQHKSVSYYILDNQISLKSKNLNYTVFRYQTEFLPQANPDDYFPLPPAPARIIARTMDVYSERFYKELGDIVTRSPKAIHYAVVAYGTDLENIDIAQKLAAKKKEWNAPDLHIFAKVRRAGHALVRDNQSFHAICEQESVFCLDQIRSSEITDMAMKRNLSYELENLLMHRNPVITTPEDAAVHAEFTWHTMDVNKRLSNLYSALGLRFKLQLMRMDAVKGSGEAAAVVDNDAYMALYAGTDSPKGTGIRLGEKELYDYESVLDKPEDFCRGGLRKNMAIQEHYRWNAFMICQGFVPASKAQILSGKSKDYLCRNHGNLTTFEGLFDYRKALAQKSCVPEIQKDVIKYDYQTLDDAWWLLSSNGYEIVRKDGDSRETV